jgi:hypothetical protein
MDCLTTDVMFHSSFSPLPETMTLLLASIVSHWPGLIVWGLGVCVVGQFAGGNACVSLLPFLQLLQFRHVRVKENISATAIPPA